MANYADYQNAIGMKGKLKREISQSSARELLEALKEVVAISDRKHNAWDRAKQAIAKAEKGE